MCAGWELEWQEEDTCDANDMHEKQELGWFATQTTHIKGKNNTLVTQATKFWACMGQRRLKTDLSVNFITT